MFLTWDVDDSTAVALTVRGFKRSLTVNGGDIPSDISLRRKNDVEFTLPDTRHAILTITPKFGSAPDYELRVAGELMVPRGKHPPVCQSCGVTLKANDRFCPSCGKPTPPPETYLYRARVKEATTAIWLLAGSFFVFGLILFFLIRSQEAATLATLNGMEPNATVTTRVDGKSYVVSQLRDQLNWAPWNSLVQNFLLGAVMCGLALWGKIAPLPAALVAAATYAVVIVTNAIISPETIGQGIYLKIIIVLFLARGIKAALALRSLTA